MLKLRPSYKDYLWGGRRLVEEYGKEYDGDVLAESWELSCHPDGPSVIANGTYAGRTLMEYVEEAGKEVLGSHCRRFKDFPILIKFIDARDNLSVQVHPDNRYALKNEGRICQKNRRRYAAGSAERRAGTERRRTFHRIRDNPCHWKGSSDRGDPAEF